MDNYSSRFASVNKLHFVMYNFLLAHNSLDRRTHGVTQIVFSFNLSMLAYYMLKHPLKYASGISQQSMKIEPRFNFLNALPMSNENLSRIRIFVRGRSCLYDLVTKVAHSMIKLKGDGSWSSERACFLLSQTLG